MREAVPRVVRSWNSSQIARVPSLPLPPPGGVNWGRSVCSGWFSCKVGRNNSIYR